MKEIKLFPLVGDFAENKDKAREIRLEGIMPALQRGEEVVLDFEGISSVTQSFIHALISDILRRFGGDALDILLFRNCNENVKKIISMVVEYMQESE
jgi:hypothetical protein